eukprot:1342202-Amphidinium_carterae.1
MSLNFQGAGLHLLAWQHTRCVNPGHSETTQHTPEQDNDHPRHITVTIQLQFISFGNCNCNHFRRNCMLLLLPKVRSDCNSTAKTSCIPCIQSTTGTVKLVDELCK